MKANGFPLSACQCKEARDSYEDNFGKNKKKRKFKVRLIHAFSKDMEILPFLAVLFKTGTAMSILGSWMPAVRAREKHSYSCKQMPLPINQKAAPWIYCLVFSNHRHNYEQMQNPNFSTKQTRNIAEVFLCCIQAFTNALLCVKSFCICQGG